MKEAIRLSRLVGEIENELKQKEEAIRKKLKIGAIYELYIKLMTNQNLYDEYHKRKYY